MIKKGLIRTCILEYLEDNHIVDPQKVFEELPNIYRFLKEHPHHKDLIPNNMTYQTFSQGAQAGYSASIFKSQFGGFTFK